MSRAKNPLRYPAVFDDVLYSLKKNPEIPFEIPCESMKQAFALRLSFYSFVSAVIEENKGMGEANRVSVTVKDNPPRVVIFDRDTTQEALMIQKLLEEREAKIKLLRGEE